MGLLHLLGGPAPAPRESLVARMGLTDRAVDKRQQLFSAKGRFGREIVEDSEDLERILQLPRRDRPTIEQQQAMADEMTARLTPGPGAACKCAELRPGVKSPCITRLLPIQGWYLFEAASTSGALGHIVVGGGKTGIDILLPMVVPNCKRAVLLIPPQLRKQFAIDYLCWKQHFKVPNLAGGAPPHFPGRPTLDLLAYSELSSPRFATWLKASAPDILIADEGQNLKDKGSTRTDRFLRYFIEAEEAGTTPLLFVHSGTLTEDSLDNYGHLSALSLRESSPVPLDTGTLGQWCEALDPTKDGTPKRGIGALAKLCTPGERVRYGFRRRLVETQGVITTEDAALPSKLRISKRDPGKVPDVIRNAIAYTRDGKMRPDGEVLTELAEVANVCRQLAAGFFYIWRYPRGESAELIDKWFTRRQAWHRELREKLEHRVDMLDSPGLCEAAARLFYAPDELERAGDKPPHGYVDAGASFVKDPNRPQWAASCWRPWAEVEQLVQPVKDTVWVDDFLVRDAVRFAAEPGVVWYLHEAFGQRVSELGGLPWYASGNAEPVRLNPTPAMLERRAMFLAAGAWEGGDGADNWLKTEDGTRAIVCSIKAHGTGKNMQAWRRCLVTNTPVKGWEQLLGRHHRQGQEAAEVEVQVYRHTSEVRDALDTARELAAYVRDTTGKIDRLLFATLEGL